MKKSLILLLSLMLLLAGCEREIDSMPRVPEVNDTDFSGYDLVEGRMRIKLKEEPAGGLGVRTAGGTLATGIRALDNSATALGITHIERTFPPAGKFEERTRREGLHLWYDVWFSEDFPATRAVGDVADWDDIEVAIPVVKVVSLAIPGNTEPVRTGTRNTNLPYNDPELSKLWSYHNPGTETWQQEGADIRLFDVWKEYNGHPDIIVAIVDGGIALDNPDLQANLWINTNEVDGNGVDDDGNGYADDIYGYNFVSGNGIITPHRHGTHVAGTIGATNNNGTGISGIAGGNGTPNSGVRLMSCQIFEHPPGNFYADNIADNIAAGIKYGADNGAVISQNSWGYAADAGSSVRSPGTRNSYIDQAHKEAIDYFVKYAGCDNNGNQLPDSPMKGGIVLFASGNNNSSNPRTASPADYEKVLGVAAIGPDYKKAPYSNYGDYMDISAPGGLSNMTNGIFSTTIAEFDYYEYRYGTSMACPHVAGVAALIIEKFGVGKTGFTARQLEEVLLQTSYNVDRYNNGEDGNTDYTGLLGYGSVDATTALQSDEPDNTPPLTLESNQISGQELAFRVNTELAGDAVITIRNSIGQLVMRINIHAERFDRNTIDISKLAAGYYTFEYVTNQNKLTEKFIKL